MFPGPSGTPLFHHVVPCARLSLQLLGPQDFVDVVQAVFGCWRAVGVVVHSRIQATVLRGGEVGRRAGAVSVEQRRLVVVLLLLPMVQRKLRAVRSCQGDPSGLDT